MKTQEIRLLDVFILGPFMIYLSVKKNGMTDDERKMLLISGIATIAYNGMNYLKEARNG